ncbi:MAG: DUF72 domain-containing protein [Planctomycetota bacterium]
MADEARDGVIWRLGTIGFSYADWAGVFYPRGVSGADRLTHYARFFDAIELDTTFYALPAPETVRRWGEAVPGGFRFTLKAPKSVTHEVREGHLLSGFARDEMGRLIDVAGEGLGPKLHTVLCQFPAAFRVERLDELGEWLGSLPGGVRYAVELRHDSWWVPETAAALRELGVTWVCADEAPMHEVGRAPLAGVFSSRARPIVPTSDVLYVRWVGVHAQYDDLSREHVDASARVRWWAERLRAVLAKRPEVREVVGFFGNGFSGFGPAVCHRFRGEVGIGGWSEPGAEVPESGLF